MLLTILFYTIITFCLIEFNHQLRIDSPLILNPKRFKKNTSGSKQKYIASVEILNTHKKMEVMIPFFKVNPQIIGIPKDKLRNIQTKIKPLHPDEEAKECNDYWTAYIVKGKKSTFIEIEVEFEIKDLAIDQIKCLWIDIEWGNYGPFGFFKRFDGFVLPNYSNMSKKDHSSNNSV